MISAGDYLGDVATWTADHLTICGGAGKARLFANGQHEGGKGIWVVQGSNVTIEDVEFHGAKVPDENGAGIRAEGNQLTLRRCGFFDNENGLLSDDVDAITIERSEFARNGFGDGQTHNLYVGRVERLTVTESFFHEAKIGHNFKSRARETVIENSYFMDGPAGTSSYLVNVPDGGIVRLRGNLFHKGPRADNSIAVSYGEEGAPWPVNTLEMVHNTFVMTWSGGSYLNASGSIQSITLGANVFAGTNGPALYNGGVASKVSASDNLVTEAAHFPGADDIAAPDFWPAAPVSDQLPLAGVPDPDYTHDAPSPFVRRAIAGPTRYRGALQAPP